MAQPGAGGDLDDDVRPIAFAATGKQITVNGWLHGWSVRESTGGAAAVVDIHDGGDATGTRVATIGVASSGAESVWLGDRGVRITNGVYVAVTSGAVVGTVWVRPA